jgi:hypothetical protein
MLSQDYRLDEDVGRLVVAAVRPDSDGASRSSDRVKYKLGWLFVVLEALSALQLALNLGNGGPLLDVRTLGALSSGVLAVTAARRSAWGWHTLLVGLLTRTGLRFYYAAHYLQVFGPPPPWALLLWILMWPTDMLWFMYFYRRRKRFRAEHRWHWVERLMPGPSLGRA